MRAAHGGPPGGDHKFTGRTFFYTAVSQGPSLSFNIWRARLIERRRLPGRSPAVGGGPTRSLSEAAPPFNMMIV
jgi:hypothetical protein